MNYDVIILMRVNFVHLTMFPNGGRSKLVAHVNKSWGSNLLFVANELGRRQGAGKMYKNMQDSDSNHPPLMMALSYRHAKTKRSYA